VWISFEITNRMKMCSHQVQKNRQQKRRDVRNLSASGGKKFFNRLG
jgi:hypothetical protein